MPRRRPDRSSPRPEPGRSRRPHFSTLPDRPDRNSCPGSSVPTRASVRRRDPRGPPARYGSCASCGRSRSPWRSRPHRSRRYRPPGTRSAQARRAYPRRERRASADDRGEARRRAGLRRPTPPRRRACAACSPPTHGFSERSAHPRSGWRPAEAWSPGSPRPHHSGPTPRSLPGIESPAPGTSTARHVARRRSTPPRETSRSANRSRLRRAASSRRSARSRSPALTSCSSRRARHRGGP